MKGTICFAAMLLTSCITSSAQPAGPAMRSGSGPWNNDVLVYRVDTNGVAQKVATFDRAGVSTLARLADGRIISAFQSFPADDQRNFDRVAVRFSNDEGRTWTKATPILVEGMESGLMRPFDPTLVPLADGRVRIFFTSNRSRDFARSVPGIYSAVSTNGIHYTFEPGVRFAIEGRPVIDCAVVLHHGVFHLFSPDNGEPQELMNAERRREPSPGGTAYHATSRDGLNFTREADVTISGGHRWLGNAQSDEKTMTFFGTSSHERNRPGASRGGVWTSTSTNGSRWTDPKFIEVGGADPGAVRLRDGGWLLTVTGPPRQTNVRRPDVP